MSSIAAVLSHRPAAKTLIASSNFDFRRHMVEALRTSNWSVEEASGGAEALAKMEAGDCKVILLDRWLPDLEVMELAGIVRERYSGIEVHIVDSESGVPLVSEEPPDNSHRGEVLSALKTLPRPVPVAPPQPPRVPVEVAEPPAEAEALPKMIGSSSGMQHVYRLSRLVAGRSTTVLITGETGTGKELVARGIHLVGPRNRQPFITVNCAAIPESLLESELFGHARGAFTGAFQSRAGRIHSAHGGTLFLDEVGELPLSMQAKLLRFLQEGEVQRLGSSDVVHVDVRVIAATNADLGQRVREKVFREDLYYRLSVFPIEIVPLRKRPDDVLLLSTYFLSEFCRESDVPEKTISPGAQQFLEQHSWPGNIRELRHVIERAFILSEHSREILPEHIRYRQPGR